MHIYKVYDNATGEQVAIEDNLTTVRNMAQLTADETSRLFRRGRVNNGHFTIVKY